MKHERWYKPIEAAKKIGISVGTLYSRILQNNVAVPMSNGGGKRYFLIPRSVLAEIKAIPAKKRVRLPYCPYCKHPRDCSTPSYKVPANK